METNGSDTLQVCGDVCRCPLCENTFKHPRILPCFHSICTDCLDTYILQQQTDSANASTFPCPECSREIQICADHAQQTRPAPPSSPASFFKPDSFITKMVDVLHALGPDASCETCVRMGEAVPGSDWCLDCLDVLCPRCTKAHQYGKATNNHDVMPLSKIRTFTLGQIMKRDATHACPKHVPEIVKFYCLNCRVSVCAQCLAESHRKCEACFPLDEAFTRQEDDVAQMMVKLNSMDVQTEEDRPEEESGAAILENSVMKAQDTIRNLAADLRKRIDDREKALIDRLYSVSSQLQEKVGEFREPPASKSDEIKTLTFASNRMDALLKYGSNLEILDLFTSMKDVMARVDPQPQTPPQSRDDSINSTTETDDEVRVKVCFELSPNVKNFLQDFESLGEISVEDFNSDEGMSSWGVCVTHHDDVIVVDCRAKKVQKFGITGDLIDHIVISEEPRDVTSCVDDDVAITIMKKQIFIVTVSGQMSLKRRMKTHKQYDAISASPSRDEFLVSSLAEKCVDVIATQGDVLKSFGSLIDGTSLFDCPRYVTYTPNGHYVVSDVTHNAVACISEEGGVLYNYNPKDINQMKSAQATCCDASGNLFVADYGKSRVHLLKSSGEFQRFVLGRDSGLNRPVAMAISHGNKLVIVQSDGMVKIFGYESMKVKFKGTCWCPRCLENMEKEAPTTTTNGDRAAGKIHPSTIKVSSPKSPRLKAGIASSPKYDSPPASPLSSPLTSPLTSPSSPSRSSYYQYGSQTSYSPRGFRNQRH